MKRREFLIILVLSAMMPCAHAQQPGKLYFLARTGRLPAFEDLPASRAAPLDGDAR